MSKLDHSLPNCDEAERAMLGSILLDNFLIEEAKRGCPPEYLYVPSYRQIFLAMLTLNERNEEINAILLAEEIRRENTVETSEVSSDLAKLTYGLPRVAT